jgi:DNA mismatch repair protein MutS
LEQLEAGETVEAPKPAKPAPAQEAAVGMDLFAGLNNAVIEELRALDLNTLTPIEALTKLFELKNKIV